MKAYQTEPITQEELVSLWNALNNYTPQGTRSVLRKATAAFEQVDELLDKIEQEVAPGRSVVTGFELTEAGEQVAESGIVLDKDMLDVHRRAMANGFEKGLWSSRFGNAACNLDEKLENAKKVKLKVVDPDDPDEEDDGDESKETEAAIDANTNPKEEAAAKRI